MKLLLWLVCPIAVICNWRPPRSPLLYGVTGIGLIVGYMVAAIRLDSLAPSLSVMFGRMSADDYDRASYVLVLLIFVGGGCGCFCLGRAIAILAERSFRRGSFQRLRRGEAVVITEIKRSEIESIVNLGVTVVNTDTGSSISGIALGFYSPNSATFLVGDAHGDLGAFTQFHNYRCVFAGDNITVQLMGQTTS